MSAARDIDEINQRMFEGKMRFDVDAFNDKNDMNIFMNEILNGGWYGTQELIDQIVLPPDMMPGDVPSLETLLDGIDTVLETVMAMILDGEFPMFQVYHNSIKTDYYEEIFLRDLDRLTYMVMVVLNPRKLSPLTYYMNPQFIHNFLKHKVVKPGIWKYIEKSRGEINRKTNLDKEMEDTARLKTVITGFTTSLLITHKFEEVDKYMEEYRTIDVPNRDFIVDDIIERGDYFIPDFLKDALKYKEGEDPVLIIKNDPRFNNFYDRYLVTHTEEAFIQLCMEFTKPERYNRTRERIINLYRSRKEAMKFLAAPEIDGMSYQEIYTIERIIERKELEEGDDYYIDHNYKIQNIKYIVDNECTAKEKVTVDNDLITISGPGDYKETYNYNDKNMIQDYNNPYYIMFGKEDGRRLIEHINSSTRNPLFKVGFTTDEVNHYKWNDPEKLKVPDSTEAISRIANAYMSRVISKYGVKDADIKFLRETPLGLGEHRYLKYLKLSDLLSDKPYIEDNSDYWVCLKLIELDQLRTFIDAKIKKYNEASTYRKQVNSMLGEMYPKAPDIPNYFKQHEVLWDTAEINPPPVTSYPPREKYNNNTLADDDAEDAAVQAQIEEQLRLLEEAANKEASKMKLLDIPKITNARL